MSAPVPVSRVAPPEGQWPSDYPQLTPRDDRLLLHWFEEDVRDLMSLPAYQFLSFEETGLLQVLRHHFLHTALIPNDLDYLHWLTRKDRAHIERALPGVLKSGLFTTTPDGQFLFSPKFDKEIGEAAEKWKNRKNGNSRGGVKSGETRRKRSEERKTASGTAASPPGKAEACDRGPPSEIPF